MPVVGTSRRAAIPSTGPPRCSIAAATDYPFRPSNESRRYLAGTENEVPPWKQKYSDAAGGWTMSAIDMVRFLTALDGSRGKPLLKEKTFEAMLAPPPPPLMPRADGTWY